MQREKVRLVDVHFVVAQEGQSVAVAICGSKQRFVERDTKAMTTAQISCRTPLG